MVTIIGGAQGSGKTQQLINLANNDVKEAKGIQVFIDYRDKYRREINNQIRFINTSEFAIENPSIFFGFICGLVAGNYDITTIYIDNIEDIMRICSVETITAFLSQLEIFTKEYKVDFILTVNIKDEEEAQLFSKYNCQTA